MTLPSSGPLALSQVNTELGRSATANLGLGDQSVLYLAGDFTGDISMSQLYGQTDLTGTLTSSFGEPDGPTYFYDIKPSASQWIAVGTSQPIITSPDLVTWTVRTANVNTFSVAANGNTVIACGSAGFYTRSTDGGVSWTNYTLGTSNLRKVIYANGLFVMGNSSGTVYTSTDGLTWNTRATGITNSVLGLAYGNGLWVAVYASGFIRTSPDTITWTARTSNAVNSFNGVAWNGSLFAAVGDNGTVRTSPDGVTWTTRTSPTTQSYFCIEWVQSRFVCGCGSGVMVTSLDGVTWNTQPQVQFIVRGISQSGSNIVTAGSAKTIATTTTSFTPYRTYMGPTLAGFSFSSLAVNPNGYFAAVGVGNGSIRYSADGRSWQGMLLPGDVTVPYNRVEWNGSYFLAMGPANRVATSTDGLNWTLNISSNATTEPRALAWGNNLWVAVYTNGLIRTSPDGVTWTSRTSGTTALLNAVAWSGSRFVVMGYSGIRLISTDGITWSNPGASVSTSVLFNDVVYASGTTWYAAAGGGVSFSGVYISTNDGVNWGLSFNTGAWDQFNGVAFIKNAVYAVGASGVVYTSYGVGWTLRPSGTSVTLGKIRAKSNRVVITGTSPTLMFCTPNT